MTKPKYTSPATKPSLLTPVQAAIRTLLASGVGYQVDLFHWLSIQPLETGKFALTERDTHSGVVVKETLYDSPLQATLMFEQRRKQLKLGFDFEITPKKRR